MSGALPRSYQSHSSAPQMIVSARRRKSGRNRPPQSVRYSYDDYRVSSGSVELRCGRDIPIPLILPPPTLVGSLSPFEHHTLEAFAVKKAANCTDHSAKRNHNETPAEMCTFVTRNVLHDDARTTALEHACQVMRKVCWYPFRLVLDTVASSESGQLCECEDDLPRIVPGRPYPRRPPQ